MKEMHRFTVLLMVLCIVGVSSATNILWCSGGSAFDQGWIDLLEERGYTVDRLEGADDLTQAKVDLANTYDLVIVGRDTISGDYANSGEPELWNSITSPVICQNGYLWRNNRWNWLNSGSTFTTNTNMNVQLASDDPLYDILFNGVILNEDGTLNFTTDSVTLAETRDAGNGVLISCRNYDPQPWVYAAYWQQGLEFYSGAGTYATGPRMALAGGYSGDSFRGGFNLAAKGEALFLNSVYFMSGATFDRKPFVNAGNDRLANTNEPLVINATAFDPDSTPTFSWTQLSGPAAVTFEDTAVVEPTVTFPVEGEYELQIAAADGTTSVADQLVVTVRDTAANALIAHWDFENLPDPNDLIDVTGNGFTGILYKSNFGDPNLVDGTMIGGSQAASLYGNTYWEVPNSYDNTDPNFNDLAMGMTAAAWVRNSNDSVTAPMIIGNGVDGWRLQVNTGTYNLVCHDIGLDMFVGGVDPYDGLWHHVVGVFDGVASEARLYVDGFLLGTKSVDQGSFLSKGDDYPLIQIANRGDGDRPWLGDIDDVRVYNYPLTTAEVEVLAAEGDLAVSVSAGEDQTVAYKGTPIQLDATLLIDDGVPAPATVEWTVMSVPTGVDPLAITFDDASAVNPQVTFPNVEGIYMFNITADDTEYTDSDDVSITLQIPSCADVLTDGLGLAADISGPEGQPDCHIDLHDFAAMAKDWLRCNDPDDPNCEWAYQQ